VLQTEQVLDRPGNRVQIEERAIAGPRRDEGVDRETFAELAAGFGVGTTTAWQYVEETVALLAARAPKLRTAVRDAKKAGYAYVVLEGTLIPIWPTRATREARRRKCRTRERTSRSPRKKPTAHAKLRAPGERANVSNRGTRGRSRCGDRWA
jgi:hypothetical protein